MSINVVLPPAVIEVDGCEVYIWNIIPTTNVYGRRRYLVTVQAKCYDKVSKQACFDVANEDELKSILKKEIAMFKSIVLSGAHDVYSKG